MNQSDGRKTRRMTRRAMKRRTTRAIAKVWRTMAITADVVPLPDQAMVPLKERESQGVK